MPPLTSVKNYGLLYVTTRS